MSAYLTEDRREFMAQDREEMRSKLSKPVQPKGRFVGHNSVTGPIFDEIEVNYEPAVQIPWADRFKDVALEIDAVLQCRQSKVA